MKTLHLRVQQQNSTAQRMAEILEAHPKVFFGILFFMSPNLCLVKEPSIIMISEVFHAELMKSMS